MPISHVFSLKISSRFHFFHSKSEIVALICASLLGMPGGCLLFIPFYHPLHDFYKVPSEVTSVSILMVFTAIVWRFDRKSNRYQRPAKMNLISKVLFGHLMVHYLINLGTAIFFNPEDVISIGLHQQIGDCNDTQPVHTVLKVCFFLYFISFYLFLSKIYEFISIANNVQTLQRNKYLCVDNYDEPYYDFHCLPNGRVPPDGSIWYTVCGTPFE